MQGEDLREGNSPSWFNAVEAVQVIRYVQELRKFKKRPVKLDDFGIITPYRKQVNYLEKPRLINTRVFPSKLFYFKPNYTACDSIPFDIFSG